MDTITTCAFRCLLRSPASQPCLHTHFTHQKAHRLPQTLLSALGAMATSEKRSQSCRTTETTLCTKTLLLTRYAYTYNHTYIVSMNVTCAVFIIQIKQGEHFFFYLLKRFSTFSSILLTFENSNIVYIYIYYILHYIT